MNKLLTVLKEKTASGRPDQDGRIPRWDNARGILIFLVVLGHVVEPMLEKSDQLKWLFFLIYLFHMPAFFFLAGLFSKRTIQEKRTDRAAGYFILFFAMKMIIFIVNACLRRPDNRFMIFTESGIPWYAFCMGVFLLATMLLQYGSCLCLLFAVALACFAGYDDSIGDFLVLSRVLAFYPFFLAGCYVDRTRLEKLLDHRITRIAGAAFLLVMTITIYQSWEEIYWLRPLITGKNPFSKLTRAAAYGGWLRLAWFGFAGLVVIFFFSLVPRFKLLISEPGKRTLAVYALHIPVLRLTNVFGIKDRFFRIGVFKAQLVPALLWTCLVLWICSRPFLESLFRKLMGAGRTSSSQEK